MCNQGCRLGLSVMRLITVFTMAANKHQHQVQFKLRRTKTLLKACRMIKSEKKKKQTQRNKTQINSLLCFPWKSSFQRPHGFYQKRIHSKGTLVIMNNDTIQLWWIIRGLSHDTPGVLKTNVLPYSMENRIKLIVIWSNCCLGSVLIHRSTPSRVNPIWQPWLWSENNRHNLWGYMHTVFFFSKWGFVIER